VYKYIVNERKIVIDGGAFGAHVLYMQVRWDGPDTEHRDNSIGVHIGYALSDREHKDIYTIGADFFKSFAMKFLNVVSKKIAQTITKDN
jgi:hypothetical protein